MPYLTVFFGSLFINSFVMSLFSVHNDKIGRTDTLLTAVRILISYGNSIESGI